jgi:uroporphyrinogen-III synthase
MGEPRGSSRTISPPRHGLRALVTRPRCEAAGLAAALAVRDIAVIIEPMIEIRDCDGPPPDLTGVQALLCTSANGVRALARRCAERGLPLFAVGDATAARGRAAGFSRVESAGGALADLVRLVRERLRPEAGRLLHVAGSAVAGDLAGDLRASGFTVARAVLYQSRPAAALSAPCVQALRAASVDFALFFSPRTAATFARLAERAGIAATLAGVTALSISTAADAALAPLRFRERHIAERPDQPGLLAALDHLVMQRRRQ